jgi:PAS domain S-box-containing protein
MSGIQQIEHLLVIEDRQGKRTIVLNAATCSVGRDPSNNVVLDSQSISRHHALLLRITKPNANHHSFRLIDGDLQGKRSKNGLTVNERPCTSHDLRHGDTILFGDDVKARYYVSASQADVEFLTSCQAEEVSGFLPNLTNPFKSLFKIDSSDRISTEAAIERLASIPELNLNPIIEIDLHGNITYLNPAALLNFPDLQEQRLAHPVLADIISQTQNPTTTYWVREIEVGNKIYQQNIHLIISGQLLRSYLVDITGPKQTEEKLKQTTALQQAIFNSADRTIIATTVDGTITTFNAAAERLLGYTATEVIGKVTPAIIHDPDEVVARSQELSQELGIAIAPGFEVFVAKARQGSSEEREWTYIHKNGSRFPVLLSVTALRDSEGNITGFLGIGNDLSKRKQAEEALRQSEERWQLAVWGNNDGIWDWNIATNEVIYSPRWKEILGYGDYEIANTFEAWETRVHHDDRDRAMEDLQAHLEQKTPFYINEQRLLCKDGSYKWILDRGKVQWDDKGNAIRMVGSSTDITERKQSEEALKQSERRFRAIFNSMFQLMGLLKPDGTLIEANQTALQFTGITGTR